NQGSRGAPGSARAEAASAPCRWRTRSMPKESRRGSRGAQSPTSDMDEAGCAAREAIKRDGPRRIGALADAGLDFVQNGPCDAGKIERTRLVQCAPGGREQLLVIHLL